MLIIKGLKNYDMNNKYYSRVNINKDLWKKCVILRSICSCLIKHEYLGTEYKGVFFSKLNQ